MLILEDGTGLPNSNSYADVQAYRDFHTDRGDASASAATADISAALIRATDLLDADYVFRSVPLSDDQALQNPRYDQTALHPLLVKATLMLARDLLSLDPNKPLDDRDIVQKTVSVGNGAAQTSKTYGERNCDRFPHITRLLKSIASPRSSYAGMMVLSRD